MRRLSVLLALALTIPLAAAHAESIEEKAQVCAACHGENGVPPQQVIPCPLFGGKI